MIDFKETTIDKLLFARFSNSDTGFASDVLSNFGDQENEDILKRILLKPFSASITTLEFSHAVDLAHNVLFSLSKAIYNDESFSGNSKKILKHLSSVSTHPNIKDGDVFIVKYDDLKYGKYHHQGLGIYKIENKETYVEVMTSGARKGEMNFKKGIGEKSIDKGCLILFTEEPYTVFIVDRVSSSTDYWMKDFVSASFKNDNVGNTFEYLQIAKDFITEEIPSNFEVSKTDQIDLLNRSIAYFKTNDTFDKRNFQKEVFFHPEIVSAYKNYSSKYCKENDVDLMDNFSISPDVVKRQARVFKSVLKLDKNFHIYIHGDKNLIEKGYDKNKGMKYYKVYFKEEI
jgi:hypothetical protein